MKKKKQNLDYNQQALQNEYLAKEKEKIKKNKQKNKPITIITYIMVGVFVWLIGYIIYFMQFKAESTIANSRNIRQDDFADVVERGDIITSDGVVIAESSTDEEGNTTRNYPYANMFAHLVGYDCYGKAGLELQGNFYMLRSNVNIFEKVYNELIEQKNRGDNLITTVDYGLQEAAYNALGGCDGAVIAIEPNTGKIRVMVSKPDYNPNDMDYVWDYLQSEEGQDSSILLNRVTQGHYAPGSTFKVVTLLEYIRENPNDYDNYTYECQGASIFDSVRITCSNEKIHGYESLADCLANSCNCAFADMGTTLDYTSYKETAESLLFNMDLPYQGEYSSSVFDIDADSRKDELPQTVIGQGNTEITPLHSAMIMCVIANDGILMEPYLIEKIENDDGGSVKEFSSKKYGQLITKEESEILTEYLIGVCEYGTASGYMWDASYKVAGKTGTAEYDNEGHTNSWFVGFSNPDNPDLVVCVIVEDYWSNGVSATYVARQIFDAYYQ